MRNLLLLLGLNLLFLVSCYDFDSPKSELKAPFSCSDLSGIYKCLRREGPCPSFDNIPDPALSRILELADLPDTRLYELLQVNRKLRDAALEQFRLRLKNRISDEEFLSISHQSQDPMRFFKYYWAFRRTWTDPNFDLTTLTQSVPASIENFMIQDQSFSKLIFQNRDSKLYLWNTQDQTSKILLNDDAPLIDGMVHPNDSNLFYSLHHNSTLKKWDLDQGRVAHSVPLGGEDDIIGFSINPTNPDHILALSSNGDLKVWDLESNKNLGTLKDPNQDMRLSMGYHPQDQDRIITWGWTGDIELWNLATKKQLKKIRAHTETFMDVQILQQHDQTLLSWGNDGLIRTWHLNNLTPQASVESHSGFAVSGVKVSDDEKTLFSWSHQDRTVKIWDLPSLKLRQTLDLGEDTGAIVEVLPIRLDPNSLITIDGYHTVSIWDLEEGRILKEFSVDDDHLEETLDFHIVGAYFDEKNPRLLIWDTLNQIKIVDFWQHAKQIVQNPQ